MIMTIIITVISTILCAIMYRMGGSGNYPRQVRVIGIPFLLTIQAYIFGCHSWWLVLSFGLTIAAISTYWDFLMVLLFKIDYDNFWLHGFMLGVAAAPIAYVTGHWWLFAARCMIMAIFMGVWCALWGWDIAEETGRGAIIPATFFMIF
jgi:hypothetical protein